jgi:hypothetical protein
MTLPTMKRNERSRDKKESRKENRKAKRNSGIGRSLIGLIAGFLIITLILSAPAKAVSVNFSMDRTSVEKGEAVVFTIALNSDSQSIDKIKLELINEDDKKILCTFLSNGTIFSDCEGITIKKTSSDYGYGYGYGDNLAYEITLDTEDYSSGDYETEITAYSGDEIFSEQGEVLRIEPKSSNYGGSVSASGSNDYTILCLNSWKCSEWSSCVDGEQKRTCGQTRSDCILGAKPEETRTCPIVLGGLKKTSYDNLAFNSKDSNEKTAATGRVIYDNIAFTLEDKIILLGLSVLIALILAIVLLILIERKKRANRARELNRIMFKPKKYGQK